MEWYFIVLLIIGAVVLFWSVFKLLTKPKFKKIKKQENPKNTINEHVKEGVGLNLEDKFQTNENVYAEINVAKKRNFAHNRESREREFAKIREKMNQRKEPKSLADQIRELPPALQMLLFDRGLAKKEYDFKSKKS